LKARYKLFSTNLPKRWKIGAKIKGGYFAFVKNPFQDVESEEVCKRLGTEMGVLVLPGSYFRPDKNGEPADDDDEGVPKWRIIPYKPGDDYPGPGSFFLDRIKW